jgi:hypothetical protein
MAAMTGSEWLEILELEGIAGTLDIKRGYLLGSEDRRERFEDSAPDSLRIR